MYFNGHKIQLKYRYEKVINSIYFPYKVYLAVANEQII